MAHKLIAANWKMHYMPDEALRLAKRLDERIELSRAVTVVLCPAFIDIYPVAQAVGKKFRLGAQNVYFEDEGAFTGEIAASMLKGLVEYVIVGHSERRHIIGEDDKLIAKKVQACLRSGLRPILCVGDTLVERQDGLATKVVIDQLTACLKHVTGNDLGELAIAYEPVWAIGTGDYAKPGEVKPMVESIRHTIEELYGEGSGHAVPVLYGGSVIPDNAKSYLEMDGVDGLLVGGASLNFDQFSRIVKSAQEIGQ